MQLLMGALFGILGVLFADPILATLKVILVDLSKHQRAGKKPSPQARRRPKRYCCGCCCCCCCCICWRIIAAPPRTTLRTRTSKVRSLSAGKSWRRRAVAQGQAAAAW